VSKEESLGPEEAQEMVGAFLTTRNLLTVEEDAENGLQSSNSSK
jgi:hypothetical protein